MKLISKFINKCKTFFFVYAHSYKLFRYAKGYRRAYLKPISNYYMKYKYIKTNHVHCNCLFCNTINNKIQKTENLKKITRDSWRVHWTLPFKFCIFFQLYNFMTIPMQRCAYYLRGTFGEAFAAIRYESLYLFFRDLSQAAWILYLNAIRKIDNYTTKTWGISIRVKTVKLLKKNIKYILNKQLKLFSVQQYFYFFYQGVKTFILSLTIAMLFLSILLITMKVTLLQHLAAWFIFGNIFFWLMSGFNFFIKRARFGKFTARLQRFWKHSFVSFWAVEGFLFSIFFYYFLNSSQEPLYMFDYNNVHNDFILNLQSGFFNTFLLSSILFSCQILSIFISVRSQFQSLVLLVIISVGVFYLFFLESYQAYYVFNGFSDIIFVFDEEQNCWNLDYESVRLRTKHYYFILCVIAKFWHFIFIFFSWLFFLLKALELRKISHNLLSFNYQNLLILFGLNLLCYCNWVRFLFRRCIDLTYFWFFTNPDQKLLKLIVEETIHIILSCFNRLTYEIQLKDIVQLIIY